MPWVFAGKFIARLRDLIWRRSGNLDAVPDIFDNHVVVEPLGPALAAGAAGFDAAKRGFG